MAGKTVFLDLEDTVIDTFDAGALLPQDGVRRFLARERPARVALFSYALWDAHRKAECARRIVPALEASLDVELDLALSPTVAELCRIIEHTRRMPAGSLGACDFFDWFGRKEEGFLQFIRFGGVFTGAEAVLLDDAVPDMEVTVREPALRIRTVNALTLFRHHPE